MVDGIQYEHIVGHDLGEPIKDLAADPTGRWLGCTLGKGFSSETVAKIVQLGRSRGGDDDESDESEDDADADEEMEEEGGEEEDESYDEIDAIEGMSSSSSASSGVTIDGWQ